MPEKEDVTIIGEPCIAFFDCFAKLSRLGAEEISPTPEAQWDVTPIVLRTPTPTVQ